MSNMTMSYQTVPYLAKLDTFPVGLGRVGLGWVGSDNGNSDNRANSVQLELELGVSLAHEPCESKYSIHIPEIMFKLFSF